MIDAVSSSGLIKDALRGEPRLNSHSTIEIDGFNPDLPQGVSKVPHSKKILGPILNLTLLRSMAQP